MRTVSRGDVQDTTRRLKARPIGKDRHNALMDPGLIVGRAALVS